MKKKILFLSAISLFLLAGCGNSQSDSNNSDVDKPVNPETPDKVITKNYTLEEFDNEINSLLEVVPTTKTSLGLRTEFLEETRYDYDIEGQKSYLILHNHTNSDLFVDNGITKIDQHTNVGQKYTMLGENGKETSSSKVASDIKETLHRQGNNPYAHYVSSGTYKVTNSPEDPNSPNENISLDREFKLTDMSISFDHNTTIFNSYTREERTRYLLSSFKQVADFKLGAEHQISSEEDKSHRVSYTIKINQNNENTTDYKEQHLIMEASFVTENNLVYSLNQSVKYNAVLNDGSKMKVKQEYKILFIDCQEITFPEIKPYVSEAPDMQTIETKGIIPYGFNFKLKA